MPERVRLIRADTFEYLPTMPAGSVHCVVTSPPYWAQTHFNSEGDRYGNAPTLLEYRAQTRILCRNLHPIIEDTGSLWVNMGYKREARRLIDLPALWAQDAESEGFLLAQRIVWDKHSSAPTPPGTKRERDAHEIVLHLIKNSNRYYYDANAARAPYKNASQANAQRQHHKVLRCTAQGLLTYAQALKAHGEIDRRTKAGENNRIMLPSGNARGNINRDGFYFDDWNKNGAIGSNIWQFGRSLVKGVMHPCPFPVRLAWECIRRTCPRGRVVLDPFMGSGTTLVAAQMLDRAAIGIEIMCEHWETAKRRIAAAHRVG